ncbi:MAG: cytochrome c [Bacteroidetes bacterium]|nr:cytochrome c [Bacteroidota bacterium]
MKKIKIIFLSLVIGTGAIMLIEGCAATQAIADKSGAALWGENCIRCHNTPSPADFSDAQWETIGMHMRLRASLTKDETSKIVAFLQTGN